MATTRRWESPGAYAWSVPAGVQSVTVSIAGANGAGTGSWAEWRTGVLMASGGALLVGQVGDPASTGEASDSTARWAGAGPLVVRAAGRGRPAGSAPLLIGATLGEWTAVDAVVELTYVLPPLAPTLLSPSSGTTVDRGIVQRFSWRHEDQNDEHEGQTQGQLRWRPQGETGWTTYTVKGTVGHYDIPAGTFPAGDVEWQVRTYNRGGWGPWSSARPVTAADQPDDLEIVSPTSGSTVITADLTIEWVAAVQDTWQAGIRGGQWADWETISGAPDAREARLPAVLLTAGAVYDLRVRVQVDGLWSPWRTITVTYDPTLPLPAVTVVSADNPPGMVSLHVGQPPPDGTPPVVAVDIDRRERAPAPRQVPVATPLPTGVTYTSGHTVTAPDGVLHTTPVAPSYETVQDDPEPWVPLARGWSPSGVLVDPTVASGTSYEYRVTAIADSGARRVGDPVDGTTVVPDGWLLEVAPDGRLVARRTDDPPTTTVIDGHHVHADEGGALHTDEGD